MISGAGTTHRALGVYFTRIAGVRSPACADRTGIFYRETAARSGYRWPCGVWPAWPWVCQFVAATFERSRGELGTLRDEVRSRTKGMASKETGRIDLQS